MLGGRTKLRKFFFNFLDLLIAFREAEARHFGPSNYHKVVAAPNSVLNVHQSNVHMRTFRKS